MPWERRRGLEGLVLEGLGGICMDRCDAVALVERLALVVSLLVCVMSWVV